MTTAPSYSETWAERSANETSLDMSWTRGAATLDNREKAERVVDEGHGMVRVDYVDVIGVATETDADQSPEPAEPEGSSDPSEGETPDAVDPQGSTVIEEPAA